MAEPDWITDQQPFETPIEGAAPGYEQIAPSFGESFGALYQQGSALGQLRAGQERGEQLGSSPLDTFLSDLRSGPGPIVTGLLRAVSGDASVGKQQSPALTAAEANAKYAPEGTTITDKPISEGLAAVLGAQKRQDIEREGILERYAANTPGPIRFATGTAAFLLDPLNLATAFVPGVGEESVLARLGYAGAREAPLEARLLARGVSGFTGGVASQAPLTALEYGLSAEDGGNYGLRQAFLDMAFSGGLNAAFHGGMGALGDIVREHPEMAAPLARYRATNAAVSQMLDGREVDAAPVFDAGANPADLAAEQAQTYRNGFAAGVPQPEFDRANAEVYGAKEAEEGAAEIAAKPKAQTETSETESMTADLEQRWEQMQAQSPSQLLPEEAAQLEQTHQAVVAAEQRSSGLEQAASCLREAGV